MLSIQGLRGIIYTDKQEAKILNETLENQFFISIDPEESIDWKEYVEITH